MQENRGKWNSLEAVSNFGWSGTSLLGGLMIDHYSYQFSFHVTAIVQLLGVLVGPPSTPCQLVHSRCTGPQAVQAVGLLPKPASR